MIEIIRPDRRWPVEEIAERFGVSQDDLAMLVGIIGERDLVFTTPAPLALVQQPVRSPRTT